MGEAKQRAKVANDTKVIEASERERVAAVLFFGNPNLVTPKDRTDVRRYDRLMTGLDLDGADKVRIAKIKAHKEETGEDGAPLTAFSSDLEEFETTLDVVEYFLTTSDAKMPGAWARALLPLAERMLALKEGTYKAPSVKAAEAAPAAPNPEI